MMREHCRQPDNCKAAGPRHCRGCAAAAQWLNPEIKARALEKMRIALLDPAVQERRNEAIRKRFDDPAYRAKHSAAASATLRTLHADPDFSARHRARSKVAVRAMLTPEGRARQREGVKAFGQRRSEQLMGWLHPSLRDEYRALGNQKVPAAERRRMMEAEMQRRGLRPPNETGAETVARITREMRAKAEREKREAY